MVAPDTVTDALWLVAQLGFLLGVPAWLAWAESRVRLVATLSPVVLCYASGIAAAQLPGARFDAGLAGGLVAVSVLLAIPMLLFPADLRQWARLARSTVLSFLLAVVAVCLASTLVFLWQGPRVPAAADVSGMLAALYTGGSPNMNAVALARGVDAETLLLVNGADVLLGSVFLLFLMTAAKPLLSRWFPAFHAVSPQADPAVSEGHDALVRPWYLAAGPVMLSLGLGGVAAGLSWWLFGELVEAMIILLITSLAIGCSLVPAVRRLPRSYETGQYLLLVFCITIGTQADLAYMLQAGSVVLAYCAMVLALAVSLHWLVARLCRIDVDTLLITSTAAYFGPPFVGPIAKVLGNREVVVSGMTAGAFGLALGNYLGLSLARLLGG